MTCESCVSDVKNVLEGAEGIKKYDINLKEQRVVVEGSGKGTLDFLLFHVAVSTAALKLDSTRSACGLVFCNALTLSSMMFIC